MGSGMARRLLEAGHDLRVYNRSAERAGDLIARGARGCATPREASRQVDAIISMVSDDAASRAVWDGPHGALAAETAPGTLAIECSTLSHDWVLELAAASGRQGFRYLDAPVTGLPESAAAGDLTLLVGADPGDLAAAQPVLSGFSRRLIHFGPVGTGTVYKLLVNMLGAVQIASVAETMALAEKSGLDLGTVAGAIAGGQAASPQVVRNARRMAEDRHEDDVVFTPQLRLKDVEYALQLAEKLGIGSPFGALAGRQFRALCARSEGAVNESKVMDIAREQPAGSP
jgi:3-hydroxyisobutyrate dehydrogenase